MRKKYLKMICIIGGCVICSYFLLRGKKESKDLMRQNVEALASEKGESLVFCYHLGSIDCEGRKVDRKYIGVR